MGVDQNAHWDSVYTDNGEYFGKEPSGYCMECSEKMLAEGVRSVLELGAGHGRDTARFEELGMRIVATDYSEISCRILKRRFRDAEIIHADLRKGLLLEKKVDSCYSHMLFTMDFSDRDVKTLMKSISDCVVKGGSIFFSVRCKEDPGFGTGENLHGDVWENDNGFAVRFYSEEDIRSLFSEWNIVSVKRFDEGKKKLLGVTIVN